MFWQYAMSSGILHRWYWLNRIYKWSALKHTTHLECSSYRKSLLRLSVVLLRFLVLSNMNEYFYYFHLIILLYVCPEVFVRRAHCLSKNAWCHKPPGEFFSLNLMARRRVELYRSIFWILEWWRQTRFLARSYNFFDGELGGDRTADKCAVVEEWLAVWMAANCLDCAFRFTIELAQALDHFCPLDHLADSFRREDHVLLTASWVLALHVGDLEVFLCCVLWVFVIY